MKTIELPHQALVGMECGASRWPSFGNHPDCWGTPWKGVVLAINNPLAWEGTNAFGDGVPSQAEVDAHIERIFEMYAALTLLKGKSPFAEKVPVLWEFGKVLWDSVESVRSYAEDLADWQRERARRLAASGQHIRVARAA